jgi:hypothetical protein
VTHGTSTLQHPLVARVEQWCVGRICIRTKILRFSERHSTLDGIHWIYYSPGKIGILRILSSFEAGFKTISLKKRKFAPC